MSHPLRENLETIEINGSESIRCVKCQFHYCRADQVWRDFCKVRVMAPASAGSLMAILNDAHRMRQFYCPSCGALVDTDFVEKKQAGSVV